MVPFHLTTLVSRYTLTTTKSPHDEYFAIAIAIAKRCLDGENPLDDDRFPASGTDFSLYDGQNS